MFVRFRTLLYGTSRWRHNPREYQHIDLCGARPQQCARAGVNRCTGRQHIIDQHQAPAGHLDLVVRRDQKCALDVVGALRSRPSDLLRCGADTFEPAMRDGDAANRRYRAGKNGRLIVSPCQSPSPMQGYWNGRIGIGEKFAASARHPTAHHGCKVEPVACI